MSEIKILLLTNRDSDNVGDQLIEESALSILRGIMANLGFSTSEYSINSRAAGIITKKYLKAGDPSLLDGARAAISNADILVFGGAPLFNYSYQAFYKRTITTLELAQEYGVPVIFSSIGVEKFDAGNPKVAELQEALRLSCVRQVTTRDDIESLTKYMEGAEAPIGRVADPVVLARHIFGSRPQPATGSKKRIGLVVTRAGIFAANGIEFSESQQREFWLETIDILKQRGYDYRLFTTGHFDDEVFLDALVRSANLPDSNVRVNINTPEELIAEISACSGVIAYRLHANIASFAYGVPAIGLTWNSKVPLFYQTIGYPERALSQEHWSAQTVVDAVEKAMAQGVDHDEQFLVSVYTSLFEGIKEIVDPGSPIAPYSYAELEHKLPAYGGTTVELYREKVNKKLRRTYESYQALGEQPQTQAPLHVELKRALRLPARIVRRLFGR